MWRARASCDSRSLQRRGGFDSGMWTQAHRTTYRQSGTDPPSDLIDLQWERLGAVDPGTEGRRAAAQDGYARGDKHDLLSAANRLSLAISAARAARFRRARRS